ncbi:MAG: hypothetical protein AB1505_07885 [Candidatus Latescibacterota bacterium]
MADRGKAWDEASPRLGLNMNPRSRHRLIAQARRWMEDGSVRLRSTRLLDQCQTFVLRDAKYQAVRGGHNDLVVAWAIATAMMWVQLPVDGVDEQGLPPLVSGQPVAPRSTGRAPSGWRLGSPLSVRVRIAAGCCWPRSPRSA